MILTAKDYEETYLALHTCIMARVPVILWGPPGQGKTSVIKAMAQHDQRMIKVLLASIREPQDFGGLPSIHEGRAKLIAPDWAQDLAADTNGILFMDEVNTAPPAVQAALLRVSLDKVAGDCYLGDGTSVVAAANPPEIAADGWDLAAPLANRFCHLEWTLPTEVVRNGIAGHWPRYTVPAVDPTELEYSLAIERVLIGGFLTVRPDLTTVMPTSTKEQGRAFPTPRSWETVAVLSAWVTTAGLSDGVRRLLVQGTIGQGASAEFLTYRENTDLPNPEELLDDPTSFTMPRRADQVFVIGAAVLNSIRNDNSADRWLAAGQIFESMCAEHPDIAVSLAREWIKRRPISKSLKDQLMPQTEFIKALIPLMTEAGLIDVA